MAKSGSFNTSAKTQDYGKLYLTFAWSIKSQDIATNKTVINWSLKGAGTTGNAYYKAGNFKVVINGATVYSSSDRIELYVGTTVASGTATIAHSTDGTKTFSASAEAGIYDYAVNCKGSGSWELDAIPRYGTVAHSLNAKTETTVKMNWSSDSTVDYLWYSTDNGTSWTGVNVTDGKSGTYTISNLLPYTTHKIKTRIRRKDSQLTTDSGALSVTTYDYPYCTDAPDFVIGEAVTLKFYNPLNRTFDFTIQRDGKAVYTWTGKSGTSYTGVNGTEAVNALYDAITDTISARYDVVVKYGTSSKTTNGDYCMVDTAECRPTFAGFTYRDTNTTVTNVTGNNQVLVKGLSTLSVTIPAANKMVTKHGATPDFYSIISDTQDVTRDYSTSDIVANLGAVTRGGVSWLTVSAHDSRGLFTAVQKDLTVVDYSKPTVGITLKRLNNFENSTTLTVSGQVSPVTVGGVDKNSVSGVKYRYRENGGEWPSTYTPLSVTTDGAKYTCTSVTLDLDNTKAFEFEVITTDKLGTATATAKVDVGVPIFMVSSNKKLCYMNGKQIATTDQLPTVPSKATIVGYAYPVGSVFITNTNTNPNSLLGVGSWTLIDKGFISVNTNAAGTSYFTPATNVTNNGTYITRAGNSLTVKQDLIVNQALSDTDFTLGKFTWSAIGITSLPQTVNDDATFSDGANGGISYSIAADGTLKQLDVVGVSSIATGKSFHVSFTMTIDKAFMADTACDKFYWKRTS
ncbi:MAG: hypothetical protein IKW46_07470 [Bacteroidaceae bacterium]|nr:hypothetical protein [Bacteroidaceae bacterium]